MTDFTALKPTAHFLKRCEERGLSGDDIAAAMATAEIWRRRRDTTGKYFLIGANKICFVVRNGVICTAFRMRKAQRRLLFGQLEKALP